MTLEQAQTQNQTQNQNQNQNQEQQRQQRQPHNQFPLSNIPYGIASTAADATPRIVTRLHDDAVFIPDLLRHGLLHGLDRETQNALQQPNLNTFAALPRTTQRHVRSELQRVLGSSDPNVADAVSGCAAAVASVRMHLPVAVGDFSDFSCSKEHNLNAGEAIFGVRKLPAGFLHFPMAYGGRASSVVVSGTPIRRPLGQYRADGPGGEVVFGPSKRVDFELEIAAVVGRPSTFGQGVRIEDADDHIFGVVLLNDWSARDIQALEMQPLGPFLGKSFGTSISPWIITLEALAPYAAAPPPREAGTELAPYLADPREKSTYAISLAAEIIVDDGSSSACTAATVCRSRADWLYWPVRALVAQQTVNGCGVRPGDLLATGTVSGAAQGESGCLLEITRGGKVPLHLGHGLERTWLLDGDAVRLTAWAGGDGEGGGAEGIGFGECVGVITPARSL